MKIFLAIIFFIIIFMIFEHFGPAWFLGMKTMQTLFSLTIAAVFVAVGFGLADTFLPDKE